MLAEYTSPCTLDLKVGTRCYAESEASNRRLRPDLAARAVEWGLAACFTADELASGMTKLRWMQVRDAQSTSATHGFRIDGMKLAGDEEERSGDRVYPAELAARDARLDVQLAEYLQGRTDHVEAFRTRLLAMRSTMEASAWVARHEVIGSSLIFVYDAAEPPGAPPRVWGYDLGITSECAHDLTHREPWVPGNREDGYLTGVDSLITLLERAIARQ